VVGAKGAGSLRGLRLGRVPSQLMLHAECPVVIVKDGRAH
jgi:nucleotide-binding universal stress UspA family protein